MQVFKYCCEDKLDDCYSKEWDSSGQVGRPVSLESHIAAVYQYHEGFATSTAGDVDALAQVILGTVKAVGDRLGVNKWKHQHDSLKQSIDAILGDVHPAMDVRERVAS